MADRNSSTCMLLNGQAAAYIAQGKYDDAETVLQESMDKVTQIIWMFFFISLHHMLAAYYFCDLKQLFSLSKKLLSPWYFRSVRVQLPYTQSNKYNKISECEIT